ncbi:DUF5997 family protein [Marisediminicola sp. LYQ134]|uniref:DUF5997 family protein n=1 Tax=unclassified Marisediminicola TaxID=2618316 RepID=UPI00398368F1
MAANTTPQTMKPETAAKKLGIFLPAAPEEFRSAPVTRDEFNSLLESPPEWLVELRKNGPHPRDVVAHKLGISNSGLARSGVTDALTTEEIQALLQEKPEWLVEERATHAEVQDENARVKALNAYKRSRAAEQADAEPTKADADGRGNRAPK